MRRRSPVGNLYINRGITGAMVARQPFGGNRLSGTGLKAGGPRLPAPVRRAARGEREHHAPRARGVASLRELRTPRSGPPRPARLTYSPVASIMHSMPPTVAWKLAFALVLVAAIATSALARAPRRSADPVELRRLVACALTLYAVGGLATLTHHSVLAGLVYAAGIAVAALAAWLSRGRDQEDPPDGGSEPVRRGAPAPARRRAVVGLGALRARVPRLRAARWLTGFTGSTSAQPIGTSAPPTTPGRGRSRAGARRR